MQPRVFISYRRRDSVALVHALHARLATRLGAERVFMDVDAIELGEDFLASIRTAIAGSDMLIAVIGPAWAGGTVPGERRIDASDDVVRLEIAEALRAGLKVVPLLIGGMEPPPSTVLPPDLAGLDRRQGFAIRDDRFGDDMELFVQRVCGQLGQQSSAAIHGAPGTRAGAREPPVLQRLADAVRRHWIEGVLQPNTRGGLISLRYRPRPDLVPNPFAELLNPLADTSTDAHWSEPTDDLTTLFEHSDRRLLLLGEPGAGKTTSLLALANYLLARYTQDAAEPVPLVLHLGSWRPAAGSLSDWLATEMNRRYRLPLANARSLLHEARLLPLLDGLDELPQRHLGPCIDAVADWVRGETVPGFMLCCRRADFERLMPPLALGGAAEIAPLDQDRMHALWRSGGVSGPALDRLAADPGIARIGQTPLMAKLAASGHMTAGPRGSTGPAPATAPPSVSVESVLDAYIVELFRRAPPARRGPAPASVLHRLGWIAARMQRAGQSELQIESLDDTWLRGPAQRLGFRLGFGALVGLFAGAILGLYWYLLTPNLDLGDLGCPDGGASGTCAAMRRLLPLWPAIGMFWGLALVAVDGWLPRRTGSGDSGARRTLLAASISSLYFCIWCLLWWGLTALLGIAVVLGPIVQSGFTLSALIATWRAQRPGLTGPAITVEALGWDWPGAGRGVLYGLPVGLGLLAINTLLLGEWTPRLLPAYMLFVLPVAGLLGGLHGRSLPGKIRPNEGIWLSARNAEIALLGFAIAGAGAGAGMGLLLADLYRERLAAMPGGPAELNPGFLTRYVLANGIGLAIIAALWFGGAEVIKHGVLRLLAAAGTPLPLHLSRFLDGVCGIGLMRRVGGGYQFAHRLLGEHIAARHADLGNGPTPRAKQAGPTP